MRELVRRRVNALGALIEHLGDRRSANLTIDSNLLMWREFDDEYDPRIRPASRPVCNAECIEKKLKEARTFTGPYVVKVADVCFVLIGQIVNRRLTAVRYQPTGGLIVNSPVETPSLGIRTRADWDHLDSQAHKASILADLKADEEIFRFAPALVRLRFYYPNTYVELAGERCKKAGGTRSNGAKARSEVAALPTCRSGIACRVPV